jgi:hypothetical protein
LLRARAKWQQKRSQEHPKASKSPPEASQEPTETHAGKTKIQLWFPPGLIRPGGNLALDLFVADF